MTPTAHEPNRSRVRRAALAMRRDLGDSADLASSDALDRFGFAVVRDVLPDPAALRSEVSILLEENDGRELPASVALSSRAVSMALAGPAMRRVYAELFGNTPVLFPNVSIRRNVTTPWHVDRAFVGNGAYLRDPSFRAYQFGVYLNGSTPFGLEVRPGSHRILQRCPFSNRALIDAYSYTSSLGYRPHVIDDVGPADVIVWDGRVFHRGSRPPGDHEADEKVAIYWSVSMTHSEHEEAFIRHLARRGRRTRRSLTSPHASADRYTEAVSLDMRSALHPDAAVAIDRDEAPTLRLLERQDESR